MAAAPEMQIIPLVLLIYRYGIFDFRGFIRMSNRPRTDKLAAAPDLSALWHDFSYPCTLYSMFSLSHALTQALTAGTSLQSVQASGVYSSSQRT